MAMFPTVLRQPDRVMGATDESPYRFEEDLQAECPVQYEYRVEKNSAKVIVYPSGAPVKFLKLRFRADLSFVSCLRRRMGKMRFRRSDRMAFHDESSPSALVLLSEKRTAAWLLRR